MITKNVFFTFFYLAIILRFSFRLYAQPENIKFSHISLEQGLHQSSIFSMLQDEKGFIWMATEEGVHKYDGYGFIVYQYEPDDSNSLSYKGISVICKDHNGILWIGTTNGFNRFDPSTGRFSRYFHNPDDSGSISNNDVYAICEDHFENLWIGTKYGLNKFNRKNNTFIRYYYSPDNPNCISGNEIKAIYEDHAGFLWIGTYGGGLNWYDRTNNHFIRYQHNSDDSSTLIGNRILCIHEDRDGLLWIGTEGSGLNAFDRGKELFYHYKNDPDNPYSISDNSVCVIYEDTAGILWLGTEFGGLNIFDRKKNRFIHYKNNPDDPSTLSANRIVSILEDNQGGLWFGTRGGGLNLYNRQTHKIDHYKASHSIPNSLSNNQIWEIYEDRQGFIWIGTGQGGANRFDRENQTFTCYRHDPKKTNSLTHDRVNDICEDAEGNLWFGTYGGIDKWNPKTGQFTHFLPDADDPDNKRPTKIYALYIDSSGIIWVGSLYQGLTRFDPKTNEFTSYMHDPLNPQSLSDNNVICIFEDSSGELWVGTRGGRLDKFDRENGRFIHHRVDTCNPGSIIGNFILSIREDRAGALWIGTNEGLSTYDKKTQRFTNFTKKDGLCDDVIYDIIEDDRGNLWMSTNSGLARFDPGTQVFRNYDVSDGLQSNEFNTGTGCKLRSGELLFGGINGFNLFHPDSIKDNPFIPPVVITEFQLFNTPVPIGKTEDGRTLLAKHISETNEITLSYKDNVFSFGFAALNFLFSHENQYAYIMEGLEKKWNYVGNRRYASYTTLPPGNYVFRVKGSNNDGVWNEEGASIKITITPPYWKTWWFYGLCLFVVCYVIATAFIHQRRRLIKQKDERERQRVTEIFNRILEQGNAAVYSRKFSAQTYDYMGSGIKTITGYDPAEFSVPFWDTIVTRYELGGELRGMKMEDVFILAREKKANRWLGDLKLIAKSGETKWLRDMTTVSRDEKGGIDACYGIVFDITDRKLAELELSQKKSEMEKDLSMAREVQMALLSHHYPKVFPKNAPLEKCALEFAHRYIPASTLAGDFFEIFPVSDHQVGILIYDVMGHGVRASLLTAYLHGLIEELMPLAVDTAAFMKKLNMSFCTIMEHFFTQIFATAFYAVMDIQTGVIRFTNAGHPAPYVLKRSAGTAERLANEIKRSEPAIGLFVECEYTTFEYTLHEDDLVCFFTDGIFEVSNDAKTMFGEERLLSFVKERLGAAPEDLLDSILNEVTHFSGSHEFADDVCLVTMLVRKAST